MIRRLFPASPLAFAVLLGVFILLPFVSGQCSIHQFACKNKRCIPQKWRCDETDDCGDMSDEMDCETRNCTDTQFTCANKKCIPIRWQCDQEDDCGDNSDEQPEACKIKTCDPDSFVCPSGICIPNLWRCDTVDDCPDGADEREDCVKLNCTEEEFTCDNNRCITTRWVCDHDNDCGDFSDEKNCPNRTCSSTEFTCDNGKCISARWRCDGGVDCTDHSDERDCPTFPAHPPHSPCAPMDFVCADRENCININWVCDGDSDCPDESDEVNCTTTCRPDQFQCKNLHCIPGHLQCNGHDECRDNSDEENCDGLYPKACDLATQFDCGDNHCIPLNLVCDGNNDCGAWEDEPKDRCNVDECKDNNGDCAQTCIDLPIGHRCECRPGFQIVGNSSCEDVDECLAPGTCSQNCTNTKGGFKCECLDGYRIEPSNRHRCRALGTRPFIIFANRHDIRKTDLETLEYVSLVSNLKSVVSMDYLYDSKTLIWADVTDENIKSAPMETGEPVTTLIEGNIHAPDRLAVDWIHLNLYWTDTEKKTIEVASLSGKVRKVLVNHTLDEPRAIVLDPLEGWMFWSDWGDAPKIERAGMDGSHRQTIIHTDIQWPNGLALDFTSRRIFWADAKLHIISSSDYNGDNIRTVLFSRDYLHHPYSLDVFEDFLYWTDWQKESIQRVNKFTGKEWKNIAIGLYNPMQIHIFHAYKQPKGTNWCAEQLNGHCSHLCLPAPSITPRSSRYSCVCPDSLVLGPDMRTCVPPHKESPELTTSTSTSQATSTQEPSSTPAPQPVSSKIDEPTLMETSPAATSSDLVTSLSGTASTSSSLTFLFSTAATYMASSSINTEAKEKLAPQDAATTEQDEGISKSTLAIIAVTGIFGVLLLVAMLGYFGYRHYMRRHITSMNFDNPVYRKTTEDQFSLEKNQFEPTRSYPPSLEPLTPPGTNDFV